MSGYRVTDDFVKLVESTGCEVSVTLMVQGTPVSGMLCSITRSAEHWQTMWALAATMGNGPVDLSTEPPTDRERASTAASWEEQHAGDMPDAEYSFDSLCLRDAMIHHGAAAHWPRCAYLVIASDHVSGVAMGSHHPAS